MYHLNIANKQMTNIDKIQFSEVGFRERQDLQEWIVSNPECLGEPLLIIQKEFNGFDNTSERLDLLALDKSGNLVIIENKTDSSGKDVVWQSVKYASYCSRLTDEKIINIFADYLRKYDSQNSDDYIASAKQRINEFLSDSTEDDIGLNPNETSQRIILVAAEFRQEVTSAVLWLMNFGINIRCIKCQLFKFNNDFFFDTQQIIPVPEVESFMIDIAEKKQEDIQIKNNKQSVLISFWSQFINATLSNAENLYANRTPSKDNWLGTKLGNGVGISVVITKESVKIRVEIKGNNKEDTLKIFDYLYQHKEEIESKFQYPINWERCPETVYSFIIITNEAVGYSDKSEWRGANEFLIEESYKMQKILKSLLDKFVL